MKKFLIALVALSPLCAAHAADLPALKAAPPIPPPSAFSWTGLYAGASIGYGWMDKFNTAGPVAFTPFGALVLADPHDGVVVGPQVGFNYQLSPMFVAGVEADWQGSTVGGGVISRKTPWFGTLRARLGVTPFSSDLMIYGTGGFAVASLQHGPFPFPLGGATNQIATGWAAGGGVEYALAANWTVKLEYLYANIGGGFVNPFTLGANPPQRVAEHTVRMGVNYQLNWFGGGPVVARY